MPKPESKANKGAAKSFERLLDNNKNIAEHPELADKLTDFIEVIETDEGYVPPEETISAVLDLNPTDPDAQDALGELEQQLQDSGLTLAITSDGGGASTSLTMEENSNVVTTVVGEDPEGDPVFYTITGGADAALFQIDAGGVLSFVAAPDYENPDDVGGDNIYDVTVQVSDGVQTDTQDIAVTVEDKTDVLVDFDIGDVTTNGNAVTVNGNGSSGAIYQVEANGFTFTPINEGDGIDYFVYHVNGGGEVIPDIVPSGGDELLIYSGMRIELTAGGTFDFGGFTLLGHVRSEAVHVTSYDEFGTQMGDTFDFNTSGETFLSGDSTYDGEFYVFDDEVANNQVAYVEINFDTVAGQASHANFLDDFVFEV